MYMLKKIEKGEKMMTFFVRDITSDDEDDFINCGANSPFGSDIFFYSKLIECDTEDAKMAFIGGQGYMHEDGTEYSEMADYVIFMRNKKCYTVEFFSHIKFTDKTYGNKKYEHIYKIKSIRTTECNEMEKKEIIEIIKQCFIEFCKVESTTAICEKVTFLDVEVRWM